MRSSSLLLLALAIAPAAAAQTTPAALDARLSPDGELIALRVADRAAARLLVLAVGDSMSRATAVTPPNMSVAAYAWVPNGRALVFASENEGRWHVVSITGERATPRELTRDVTGPTRLAGFAHDSAVLLELPGRWPDAPDLYRVDLASGERTVVARNDGGVTRWHVDERGTPRLMARAGEEGNVELVRVRGGAQVPVLICSAEEPCDPLGFHPDGRIWVRTTRNGMPVLMLFDPLTHDEEITRHNLANDPEAAFRSDSLYDRDTARLRELLGEASLAFATPTADGARMLVEARDADGGTIYLFDRWAGTVTAVAPVARPAASDAGPAMGGVTPDPAQIASAQLRYVITDEDGTPPTTVERRIERRTMGQRAVWRVVDRARVPVFDAIPLDTMSLLADPTAEPAFDLAEPERLVDAADTTVVDGTTLHPIARRTGGPFSARFDFVGGGVTGEAESGGFGTPVDLTVDGTLWTDGAALELLVAALPLAAGYTAQFMLFDGDALDTATVRLSVAGTDRVRTPAGEFDAWRVTIAWLAPDGAVHDWLVRRDAPHYLIRGTTRLDDLVRTVELIDARGLR